MRPGRTSASAWALGGAAVLVAVVLVVLLARSPRGGGEAAPQVGAPERARGELELASERRAEPERVSVASVEPLPVPRAAAESPDPPPPLFHGRAVADESGAPIAGARVEAEGAFDVASVASDADGRFAWLFDEQRRPELLVRAAGRCLRLVRVAAGHADAEHAVEVRLALGATIDARIRSGRATAGMRLVVTVPRIALHELADAELADGTSTFEAPFSDVGRAVLAELAPRAPLVVDVIDGDGLVRAALGTLALEPGETRALDVDLGTDARLTVRAVDQDGAPVRGRRLLLTRRPETPPENGDACYVQYDDSGNSFQRVRTDDAGLAVFARVAAGTWWLGPEKSEPSAARDDVAAVARRIELADGVRDHEHVLRLDRGLYVRGRIVDASGAPVARAYVGCESADLGGWVTGDVAPDGCFELGPLAAGIHRVRAIPHGEYVAPEPQDGTPYGPPLVFTLARGGEIAGLVLDASTGEGVRADWICSRSGGELVTHGSLGDDGVLGIGGLASGTYSVSARTSDGRAGCVDRVAVEAGRARDGVRVELAPAARIALHYGGGPERASCTVRAGGAAVVVDELVRGVRREWFVPAGRLTVSLARGDGPPWIREVDAVAGQSVAVAFELE